jgi:hypothetical protein
MHELEYQPFWFYAEHEDKDQVAETVNGSYDYCVFVTANILSADFNLEAEVEFLSRIKIPVVLMSVGVQRVSGLATETLTPSIAALLECLKQDNFVCFTRGRLAFDFLKHQGINNVIEACCPSTFNFSNNILKGLKSLQGYEWTGAGEILLNGYLESATSTTVEDLKLFSSAFQQLAFVYQDEPLLFNTFEGYPVGQSAYDEASGRVELLPSCLRDFSTGKPIDYYAYFDPVQWRARASVSNFSFGRRFHGNLAALQAGVPSIFVGHDDRVVEMLSSVGFPYIDALVWKQDNNRLELLDCFVKKFNYAATEDSYRTKEQAFHNAIKSVFGS